MTEPTRRCINWRVVTRTDKSLALFIQDFVCNIWFVLCLYGGTFKTAGCCCAMEYEEGAVL